MMLTSVPVFGQGLGSEGGTAQPWDLDPAEITVCKRPDGSDWVLGVGSFGQVTQTRRASAIGALHHVASPAAYLYG